jgi:hypothetical protein
MALGYYGAMRRYIQSIALWLSLYLFLCTAAWADVAVVLNVSASSVSVQRVQRATDGHDPAMAEAFTAQRLARRSADKPQYPVGMLVLEAINDQGEVIHHEIKNNPLRVHAPGGSDVVFPSTLLLIRLPLASVWLQVKLPNSPEFFRFELDATH